ncbi:hypothetical protein ACFQY5_17105 [Paeniroseomonas aquatica]|uniref:hypothetical protein n=1 Tax=Paeniroseomonas aquatica TaxID=373043 RepID=UPI0036084CA3
MASDTVQRTWRQSGASPFGNQRLAEDDILQRHPDDVVRPPEVRGLQGLEGAFEDAVRQHHEAGIADHEILGEAQHGRPGAQLQQDRGSEARVVQLDELVEGLRRVQGERPEDVAGQADRDMPLQGPAIGIHDIDAQVLQPQQAPGLDLDGIERHPPVGRDPVGREEKVAAASPPMSRLISVPTMAASTSMTEPEKRSIRRALSTSDAIVTSIVFPILPRVSPRPIKIQAAKTNK